MQFKSTIRYADDHVYYNVNLLNIEKTKAVNAEFRDKRQVPILLDPSLYHFTVARFKIQSTNIPIFKFIDNEFYVTLSIGNDDYTEVVQYLPSGLPEYLYPGNKFVFSINLFLEMINNALDAAFTNLKAAHPLTASAVPLLMQYNPTTKLISILVPEDYLPGADDIKIWFNTPLYQKFPTFQHKFEGYGNANKKDFEIVVKDFYTNTITINTVDYLIITQEDSALGALTDLSAIVFTTANIPVKSEFLSAVNGQNNVRTIITDFEPSVEAGTPVSAIAYQYFPQGPYRLIDMLASSPLDTLDLALFLQFKDQSTIPLRIEPGGLVTVKLLFQRKRMAYMDSREVV